MRQGTNPFSLLFLLHCLAYYLGYGRDLWVLIWLIMSVLGYLILIRNTPGEKFRSTPEVMLYFLLFFHKISFTVCCLASAGLPLQQGFHFITGRPLHFQTAPLTNEAGRCGLQHIHSQCPPWSCRSFSLSAAMKISAREDIKFPTYQRKTSFSLVSYIKKCQY